MVTTNKYYSGYTINPDNTWTPPFDLSGKRIPIDPKRKIWKKGRSTLDNIYGASTDPNVAANPPSRFIPSAFAGKRNFSALNLSDAARQKIINDSYIRNNLPVPASPVSNQKMMEMANVRKQPAKTRTGAVDTPPNWQDNLLDYVISPEGQGFAQGLLEASGYSPVPKTMGEALALASKRSGEAVDTEFKKEQQKFLNLMKEKELGLKEDEFGLKEKKAEREEIVFDRAILKDDKSKEIFDSLNKDDYANDREYYAAAARKLLEEGFIAEGTKLAELGKATTIKDFTKEIISASKEEQKTFNIVKKGVDNFKQILDAAEQEGGASSYALMIKFIKQLDDSVVREGEVRTFGTFQGLYNQLKIEVDKFKGQGFPPEIKEQIVNLANKTVNRLVTDYETYSADKSENLYTPLGIPPSMVFAGLALNTEGLDLTREYTQEDFSESSLGFKKNLRSLDTNSLMNQDISGFSEAEKKFYEQLLDERIKDAERKSQ